MAPGARWLRSERERRGLTQSDLAPLVDVAQERISAYERAQDEPPTDFARDLARVFGLSEIEVWRGLRKPLPAEFRNDRRAVEWAWRTVPEVMTEVMEQATGVKKPLPQKDVGRKPPHVTREGDNPPQASPRQQSAV